MNGPNILENNRNSLAELISGNAFEPPQYNPIEISPWLAMSLMQKAIRRGRLGLALQSASTLLRDAPEKLWRRLCVTAMEDIGCGDFETVSLVMAGLTGKNWRSNNGGDWRIASFLVKRMCETVKCRAADDLAYVCELHPDYEQARLKLTYMPIPELLKIIVGKDSLPKRALALWFAIGTHRCRSMVLRERRGDPHAVLDVLCDLGFPETVVEVCRVGLTKSGEIMAPLTILLLRELQGSARLAEPDDLPKEEMISKVPSWAFDTHTREGKKAISHFLKTNCETTRWFSSHVPPAKRTHLLGDMIFSVEGGCVDQRLRWETGDRLKKMVNVEVSGIDPKDMEEGLKLLSQDLPKLNEARHHVVGGK